jgi:hypothetical protein
MEKLERLIDYGNKLTLVFDEARGTIILDNIIHYMLSSGLKYSYIVFGYNEWSFDLSNYYISYPELKFNNHGIIQLKEKERTDISFLYKVLNNYEMAALYINDYKNLDQALDFTKWRKSYDIYGGYAILDMLFDYITIDKDSYLPDWNFSKLGIII